MPIDEAVPFWIDALYINQQDNTEKSDQVRMRREIYEKAIVVRVWLGPRTLESDIAMDLVDGAAKTISETIRSDLAFEDWYSAHSGIVAFLYDRQWEAFFSLCARSYWKRMWIVQELVVNLTAKMFCGTQSASIRMIFFILISINKKALDS